MTWAKLFIYFYLIFGVLEQVCVFTDILDICVVYIYIKHIHLYCQAQALVSFLCLLRIKQKWNLLNYTHQFFYVFPYDYFALLQSLISVKLVA